MANGIMLMTAAQCPSRPPRVTLNPFIPPWSHHCLLNQCEQQGPKTPPSLPPFGQAEVMPAVRDRQRDGDRHAEDRQRGDPEGRDSREGVGVPSAGPHVTWNLCSSEQAAAAMSRERVGCGCGCDCGFPCGSGCGSCCGSCCGCGCGSPVAPAVAPPCRSPRASLTVGEGKCACLQLSPPTAWA